METLRKNKLSLTPRLPFSAPYEKEQRKCRGVMPHPELFAVPQSKRTKFRKLIDSSQLTR